MTCDDTHRQQHPHSDNSGDQAAPPSLPAGWQQLENGHSLQKTRERYSWLFWVFAALQSQRSQSFLYDF